MTRQAPRPLPPGDEGTARNRPTFAERLFSGRGVLVTGGTSGIGLEIARAFAELGAEVTATGSRREPGAGERAPIRFRRADVRSRKDLEDVVDRCARIDVLVTAAGVSRPGKEDGEAVFRDGLEVNLAGVHRTVEAAAARLEETGGSIVTIGSMLSFLGSGALPAYTASKTGLVGLTRALADRFGPVGVRANCVAPGYVPTRMTAGLQADETRARRMVEATALGRWGQARDIAAAAVFLASPAASYITGVVLPVDGGLLATNAF